MLHKDAQFLVPSIAPLYTTTRSELGHQVVHKLLSIPDTQLSVPPRLSCTSTLQRVHGQAGPLGQRDYGQASAMCR